MKTVKGNFNYSYCGEWVNMEKQTQLGNIAGAFPDHAIKQIIIFLLVEGLFFNLYKR